MCVDSASRKLWRSRCKPRMLWRPRLRGFVVQGHRVVGAARRQVVRLRGYDRNTRQRQRYLEPVPHKAARCDRDWRNANGARLASRTWWLREKPKAASVAIFGPRVAATLPAPASDRNRRVRWLTFGPTRFEIQRLIQKAHRRRCRHGRWVPRQIPRLPGTHCRLQKIPLE